MTNEVYFITGASNGIGKAFLELMIKENKKVIILVRKKKNILKYQKKIFKVFIGDVNDTKVINSVFSFCNKNKINLKSVINNAGERQRKNFLKIKKKDLLQVFETNFFSIFYIIQNYIEYLVKSNSKGSIVNISSIVGKLGFSQLSGYGSSKSALNGLTRCLAAEYGERIRINSINPGFTKTSFYKKFKKKQKLYNWTLSRKPMKRWGEPSEIANLIYFLSSDKSSYINGEEINIDGGWVNT